MGEGPDFVLRPVGPVTPVPAPPQKSSWWGFLRRKSPKKTAVETFKEHTQVMYLSVDTVSLKRPEAQLSGPEVLQQRGREWIHKALLAAEKETTSNVSPDRSYQRRRKNAFYDADS